MVSNEYIFLCEISYLLATITWEEASEGELLEDDEEEGLASETLVLVFGFFGLTLFTLEEEGCFNPNET